MNLQAVKIVDGWGTWALGSGGLGVNPAIVTYCLLVPL